LGFVDTGIFGRLLELFTGKKQDDAKKDLLKNLKEPFQNAMQRSLPQLLLYAFLREIVIISNHLHSFRHQAAFL